uniref:Uncharacterized protein n=1 Tax=Amphimedon queenslandica TaxID=400682 RepID=A0A1X7U417_AMPQE
MKLKNIYKPYKLPKGRKKVGLVTFVWATPPKLATQINGGQTEPEASRAAFPPSMGSASTQQIGPPSP